MTEKQASGKGRVGAERAREGRPEGREDGLSLQAAKLQYLVHLSRACRYGSQSWLEGGRHCRPAVDWGRCHAIYSLQGTSAVLDPGGCIHSLAGYEQGAGYWILAVRSIRGLSYKYSAISPSTRSRDAGEICAFFENRARRDSDTTPEARSMCTKRKLILMAGRRSLRVSCPLLARGRSGRLELAGVLATSEHSERVDNKCRLLL